MSALPLVVCGLDRAGEGDDVRRKHLDEQTVRARPRPALGVHAPVEHLEEGLLVARDRVQHPLQETVPSSAAGCALADLAEPDVGLPCDGNAVGAREAHGPQVRGHIGDEEAILHGEVPREGLRRRAHQIVEKPVVDPSRLEPWHRPSGFADGWEGEEDDDGKGDQGVWKVPLVRSDDTRHGADDEGWSIPGLLPDARGVRDARARVPGLGGAFVGQRELLRESVDARELDRRHVAVVACRAKMIGHVCQHVGERFLVAGIPGRGHRDFLAGFVAAVVRHGEIEAPEAQAERRLLKQPLRRAFARRDGDLHRQMVRPRQGELAVHRREVVRLERRRDFRPSEVNAHPIDPRDGEGFVEVAVLDRPVVGPHEDPVGGCIPGVGAQGGPANSRELGGVLLEARDDSPLAGLDVLA